jgi:hypothetical protein
LEFFKFKIRQFNLYLKIGIFDFFHIYRCYWYANTNKTPNWGTPLKSVVLGQTLWFQADNDDACLGWRPRRAGLKQRSAWWQLQQVLGQQVHVEARVLWLWRTQVFALGCEQLCTALL